MLPAMVKTTPDGVFTVSIESEGFDESKPDAAIDPESMRQLIAVLEELAQACRYMLAMDAVGLRASETEGRA